MAKRKEEPLEVSKEQLLAIIAAIEFACKILLGLIPILKQLIGRLGTLE